jgi:type IV pilus assembly protein PilB
MKINEQFLKKILVESGLISQKDFNLAKKEAKEKQESLIDEILNRGLIFDEQLGRLIADAINFPFVDLRKTEIKKEVLNIIPEILAREKGIIAFERNKKGLKVALLDPENLELREFIERKTGEKVWPYYATEKDIRETLKYYKREIKEVFDELTQKTLSELKKTTKAEPLPIIKMVDQILSYGYENRASDIHLEPYKQKTVLRYRIDGVLHDVLTLPKIIHDFLVSRIKILAKLRTDIHEAAQDGHFSFSVLKEEVDVRVSVVPIEEGEKVVLRVLSEKTRRFELEDLGLGGKETEIIKKNIEKTWGQVLISGPTGCGKTTTLYAILKILNTRDVNICTIEDPIEYDIEGINQIQVNPKTGLTFSQGLKAIIRQDPNIIMVGEIRDQETAKLAINAAMTGHLVLSTFHATDSATTLPRLLEMGIEPFLAATTLNLVIAQRLVRTICPKCIESYEVSFKEIARLLGQDLASKLAKTQEDRVRFPRGRGCPLCQGTGYLGRTGIFEVLEIKEPIKKLIMDKAPASQIRTEAQKLGMQTMVEDGLKKMERGVTTLEEVVRAVRE